MGMRDVAAEKAEDKAARLVAQGRVHPITQEVFRVEGDTGVRLVTIISAHQATPPTGTGRMTPHHGCTCPAGLGDTLCSHVRAALRVRALPGPDPFDDLAPEQDWS